MPGSAENISVEIANTVLAQHYFAYNLITQNSPPLPGVIWHYTTADGLLGIINTQQLYMSHILCMNDTEEYAHGINYMKQAIAARDRDDVSVNAKRFHAILSQVLASSAIVYNVPDIFVSCFTGETDTLTHWLEYGHNRVGYAIGFDTSRLKNVTGQHCSLRACVYNDSLKQNVSVETLAKQHSTNLLSPTEI